ncbi:MAG: hypothetical protein JXR58_06395 [Bacteroidales bacterium]|nr:hypothetical protein [Bacteroidales bacterium]
MDFLQKLFENQGGEFYSSRAEIQTKLQKCKAVIFDWDGVFNTGEKTEQTGSPFSEIDSMGLNMLRLSFWLLNKKLPFIGIITGQKNPTAIKLAKRESYNAVYFSFLNKSEALMHLEKKFGILPTEVAFVFDDILDLSVARKVALRFYVRRAGNPMTNNYISSEKLLDYATGNEGGNNAVREVCELICACNGNFDQAVNHRIEFDATYQNYLKTRGLIEPGFFYYYEGTTQEIVV